MRTFQKNEVDELGTVLKTILLKLESAFGSTGVQLHHPHVAVRYTITAPLSLAYGDYTAADARGGVRVGDRILHQFGAAGTVGERFCAEIQVDVTAVPKGRG